MLENDFSLGALWRDREIIACDVCQQIVVRVGPADRVLGRRDADGVVVAGRQAGERIRAGCRTRDRLLGVGRGVHI